MKKNAPNIRKKSPSKSDTGLQLLKVKDAAKQLQVSTSTIYSWVQTGYLSATVINRGSKKPIIRIHQNSIDKLIGQNTFGQGNILDDPCSELENFWEKIGNLIETEQVEIMGIYSKKENNGPERWYMKIKVNGKQYHRATPTDNEAEAQAFMEEFKQKLLDKGQRLADVKPDNGPKAEKAMEPDAMTFRGFIPKYMEIKKDQGRNIVHIGQIIERSAQFFKDQTLCSLKPSDVDKFMAWLSEQETPSGKPLSRATCNRYLAQVKNFLTEAEREGHIEKNPARFTRFLKEHNIRDRVASPKEMELLLSAAAEHLRPIILTAYHTGMRRGEILGLTWDRINLSEGFITLNPENTKTDEGRVVPLNKVMLKVLKDLKKKQVFQSPYVFTYKGGPIIEIKRSFNSACRRAGIKDFRFHDLRHCFITNARKAGIHDSIIMSISGHKTLEVFHRYNRVDKDDLKNGVDAILNSLLD